MWSQLLCHIAAMYHSFNFLRPNIGCVYACIGKEMYYIIIVFLIGYITLSEYTTTNLYLWQQVLSGTTCWNEILLYYVHHMSIQIKISLNCILESGIISCSTIVFYSQLIQLKYILNVVIPKFSISN